MFEKCEVCYREITHGTKNGDLLIEVKRIMRGKLVTVGLAHLTCVEEPDKAFYGRTIAQRNKIRNNN